MPNKGTIIKRILKETDKWTIEELLYWRLKDLERYLRYIKFKKGKDMIDMKNRLICMHKVYIDDDKTMSDYIYCFGDIIDDDVAIVNVDSVSNDFLKENGLKIKEKYYNVDLKSGYHIISGKNRKDLVLKYYDVETQRKLNKVRQKEYYLKLVDDLNNFKENTKFEKKER